MSHLRCWDVDCQSDGVVTSWSVAEPTDCPNDPAHVVNAVTPTAGPDGGDQPKAPETMHLTDGAGRVFEITVDQNGALSASQVFGDPPA